MKEKKLLSYFLVSSFIVTALDLYGPVLVQELIDISIPEKNINSFIKYSIFLLFIYMVRYGLSLYSSSRGQLMGNRIKFHMREDLFRKILFRPIGFFKEKQSGDLITRVTSDLESVSSLLHRGLEDLLFSILAIAGSLLLMLNFNWKLAIFTMLPLPFAIWFTLYQNKKLKKGYLEIRKNLSQVTSSVHDILRTIFFLKDNLLEKDSLLKFSHKNRELLQVESENIFTVSNLMSGINFYNQITQLIVIFFGGYFHIKGELSLGVIVSFILLTNRFRIYLMRLMGLIDTYQRGTTGIGRFMEIINLPEVLPQTVPLTDRIDSIHLNNLTFSYEDNTILKNLNIQIKKGEKIAFVGESGIGKSTILSILKGELLPKNGEILLNDTSLSLLNREEYLKNFGIVNQYEHILNESISENLQIVNRDSREEDLLFALEKVCLRDLYDEHLSKGEVKLGEGGNVLSTGQKQRIALARLFLKKPEVIILDEATSALDNLLEGKIMENILLEFKESIIVAVAHRLHSLRNFDKIFVLEKNGICESGSYDELMNLKGTFFSMVQGSK
ncbi:MAG: ABC transporter ATP-binding protein [Fusobacteriaceae bacterium]